MIWLSMSILMQMGTSWSTWQGVSWICQLEAGNKTSN